MARQLYMGPSAADSTQITAKQMLERAVGQINSGGWHQGDFYDENMESMCALGAVNNGMKGHFMDTIEYHDTMDKLLANLKAIYPTLEAETIPEINDDPQVTQEGILQAFKETIDQLENA